MDADRRARVAVRRVTRAVGRLGRRVGILPHQPEVWTTEDWGDAYRAGTLSYYGGLRELARYSVLVGYVGWYAEAIGRRPSLLDVGCGTGLLCRRLGEGMVSEYVGVDVSAGAIEEAQASRYPSSRFIVGDIAAVDLEPFDIVVVNEVLYYAPEPSDFLERMRSVLRPDGLLLVSMWRHAGDRSLWRTADQAFPLVDRVDVRNRANPINRNGWRVAAYGTNPVTQGS